MVKRAIIRLVKQLVCALVVAVVLIPIILIFFTSFEAKADMAKIPPLLLPLQGRFTLENLQKALSNKYMLIGSKNMGIILVMSMFFNVMSGTITAFIVECFQFRFKGATVVLFFIGILIPNLVTEVIRLKVISSLNLYSTLGTSTIVYVVSDLIQLYIYRQFISTPSISLDESTLFGGCGYFRLSTGIIFPLLASATATAAIIKAINIIDGVYTPYLYMLKDKLHTPTTFLMNYANAQHGSWQSPAAGIVTVMLSAVLIYLFFQRYILARIAARAVKE